MPIVTGSEKVQEATTTEGATSSSLVSQRYLVSNTDRDTESKSVGDSAVLGNTGTSVLEQMASQTWRSSSYICDAYRGMIKQSRFFGKTGE